MNLRMTKFMMKNQFVKEKHFYNKLLLNGKMKLKILIKLE